jgi:uncharacterized protein YbbC (DUF1343 family)
MARDFSDDSRSTRRVFLKQQAALLAGAWTGAGALLRFGMGARLAAHARDGGPPAAELVHTRPGIDSLEDAYFAPLLGKRVGLITNQTSVDSRGRRTIDMFTRENGLKVAGLFSPEHGIKGDIAGGAKVGDGMDAATGARVFSLYGETRRPTAEMLAGIDALVFDIQDAGVRFYTYITTMAYAMEEAAKRQIPFFVLDRPNPLGGEVIEGPILGSDRVSFVGYFPMPVRYAMTIGELAQMFNAENKIGVDLRVIAMRNWSRSEIYGETGLAWIAPSPNLRTPDEVFAYPGLEILQAGDVSVGRGTDAPFEVFGAPWMRGTEVAAELNGRAIPGVRFAATTFTPRSDLHAGESCEGASVRVTDVRAFRSMRMGMEIADALHRMYPSKFRLDKIIFLVGSQATVDALKRGENPGSIVASWKPEVERFRAMREKYLIYRSDADAGGGATKAAN